MRLHEHADFDQFVIAAASRFQIPEPFIEKDYHLTEALRATAAHLPDRVIFKGGTSLSKCWGLIRRFSEDLDLYILPTTPPQSAGQVDKELRKLKTAVAESVPALIHVNRKVNGGRSRLDVFRYEPHFALPAGLPATIQLEPGVQGGELPNDRIQVRSYIAQALAETTSPVDADDLYAFGIRVLHFSRTFMEKLFAVHGLVVRLQHDGTALGRDARHYYDLHELAARPEVLELLQSDHCETIRRDVDRVCREFYPDRYHSPHGLRLATSPAVNPPESLRVLIADDYERECARLCYDDGFASFAEVLERLQGLEGLL